MGKDETPAQYCDKILKEIEQLTNELEALKSEVNALKSGKEEVEVPRDGYVGERWKEHCVYLIQDGNYNFSCYRDWPSKSPKPIKTLYACDICQDKQIRSGDLRDIPLTRKKTKSIWVTPEGFLVRNKRRVTCLADQRAWCKPDDRGTKCSKCPNMEDYNEYMWKEPFMRNGED